MDFIRVARSLDGVLRVGDVGFHLELKALCPFCDIMGYSLVITTRGICQAICVEVQGFLETVVHGAGDLQCEAFLMTVAFAWPIWFLFWLTWARYTTVASCFPSGNRVNHWHCRVRVARLVSPDSMIAALGTVLGSMLLSIIVCLLAGSFKTRTSQCFLHKAGLCCQCYFLGGTCCHGRGSE